MLKVIWCSHSFRQMLIAEKGIQEFTLRIPIFSRISKGLASSYLAWIGDDTLLGGCSWHRKLILQGIFGEPERSFWTSPLDDQNPALDGTKRGMGQEPLPMCRKDTEICSSPCTMHKSQTTRYWKEQPSVLPAERQLSIYPSPRFADMRSWSRMTGCGQIHLIRIK